MTLQTLIPNRVLLNSTLLLCLTACTEGDVTAGKQQAQLCLMCHKANTFAGKSSSDISKAIKTKMSSGTHPSVGELTKQDRANLAAFFAAQE